VLTRRAISTSVTKHGGPIKSILQNLCSGLICNEMASTCMIMTKGDDIGLVKLWYASPNDLIGTILGTDKDHPKEKFSPWTKI
jgi:hypothetical protein